MKKNKIILRIFLTLSLILGGSYIIFQNKVKKVKSAIPIIENKAYDKNEKQKTYWIERFKSEKKVNYFIYEKGEEKTKQDTLVSFFIYKTKIPINTFKECFFECAYHHNINTEKHDDFTVVGLTQEAKNNTPEYRSKYFYVKLQEDITIN